LESLAVQELPDQRIARHTLRVPCRRLQCVEPHAIRRRQSERWIQQQFRLRELWPVHLGLRCPRVPAGCEADLLVFAPATSRPACIRRGDFLCYKAVTNDMRSQSWGSSEE